MTRLRYFLLLFVLIVISRTGIGSYTPEIYFLDQECTTTILFEKDMILKFSENTTETDSSEWSCDIVLQAQNTRNRLLITPININITEEFTCNDNALYILDSDGQPLNDPPWICGEHLSRPTLNTTGGYAWFQYTKSDGITNPGSFEFLITAFTLASNGTCPSEKFLCNSGLCVSSDVECNGYNDCGDNSDEDGTCPLSVLDIILIGVGSGLFVIIVITTVTVLVVRARKRKNYQSVQ